jgi:hypothetical protein
MWLLGLSGSILSPLAKKESNQRIRGVTCCLTEMYACMLLLLLLQ